MTPAIDMPNETYEHILSLAVEEAKHLIGEDETIKQREDEFHFRLFDRVLTEIDKTDDSWVEAADVSEVCQEVEGDILHGDILGL